MNEPGPGLFAKMGFERWGFMPRVARLEGAQSATKSFHSVAR